MKDKRGLTIHFVDGTSLSVDFPKQTPNDYAAVLKLKEVVKDRLVMVEVDGALLSIPFENVKYFQIYPVADKLPENAIKGGSITG